jgi:hypothetical protein
MPYANREREYARSRERYEQRLAETQGLLQRGQTARYAIEHLGLEPHLGLLYTIWPERFPEVQQVMDEEAA